MSFQDTLRMVNGKARRFQPRQPFRFSFSQALQVVRGLLQARAARDLVASQFSGDQNGSAFFLGDPPKIYMVMFLSVFCFTTTTKRSTLQERTEWA